MGDQKNLDETVKEGITRMNEMNLQKFTYTDHEVRVIDQEGTPWFVGKDVAEVLGYSNARDALVKHVDEEDKQNILKSQNATLDIPNRGLTVINESGLYSLILSSKLPSAKQFKRWVTGEVLPAIRKHGAYMTTEVIERTMNDPDYIIGIVQALKEERAQRLALEAERVILLPKAEYCDAVLQSPSLIATNVIAKDYGMSARRFNIMLENMGIQYKRGGLWEVKAAYQDQGYVQTETFQREEGGSTYHWNKWTEKGRKFLYDTLKAHEILPVSERPVKNSHLL